MGIDYGTREETMRQCGQLRKGDRAIGHVRHESERRLSGGGEKGQEEQGDGEYKGGRQLTKTNFAWKYHNGT